MPHTSKWLGDGLSIDGKQSGNTSPSSTDSGEWLWFLAVETTFTSTPSESAGFLLSLLAELYGPGTWSRF